MALGLDPVSNTAGQYYGGREVTDALGFGGSKGLSPGQRYQNELEDRRAQINGYQGIDPYLLTIINGQAGLPQNLDPETLLKRYQTVYNAGQSGNAQERDAASYIGQIYGDLDNLNQYAYNTFQSIYGRAPTANELTSTLPYFAGTNGRQTGAAYLANAYNQYKQSPEYLASQAGAYSNAVGADFHSLLGRDATQDELTHFGSLLAGGWDDYTLKQYLQQLPEYQQTQDKKFRSELDTELQGYDDKFFNREKENVISRLAGNWGGQGHSSALDFALTDLMGQLAEKRGSYLANLSAQQYGGNKDAARQDYVSARDKYYADQNYSRARNDATSDYYRNRSDSNLDYMTQMDDYNRMMNSQRNQNDILRTKDWISLGLNGANTAANMYGSYQRGNSNPYGYLNY